MRSCTEQEALEIINSKGVVERLGFEAKRIKPNNLGIVNERMLVIYQDLNGSAYFHPCQSRKNWRYIHEDIEELKVSFSEMGYNSMITEIDDKFKTTQNLAKKHGFEQIDRKGNEGIFLCHL